MAFHLEMTYGKWRPFCLSLNALSPNLLQEDHDAWDEFSSSFLQRKDGLWSADEDLGLAVLDVLLEVELFYDDLDPITVTASTEVGPRVL